MSETNVSSPAADEDANQSESSSEFLDSGLSTLTSLVFPSIRWRLTLWYSGSLCVLLAGFGVLVWTMTSGWLLSQTDLELTEELAELLDSIDSSNDDASLRKSVAVWSELHEPYGFDFEIRSADGTLLMRSERLRESGIELSAVSVLVETAHNAELPALGLVRLKQVSVDIDGRPHRLWIAVSQREQQRLLHQLSTVIFVAGLIVMIGAGWGGWMLARHVLRPIDEMTSAAARISASQIGERVPVENPHDELGRLAQTLNTMLDRLDQSFAELKRFTADAAHELRTPLTLLRSELEVCLRKPRSAEDYEQTLRSALDDTQRMCRLAEQLLELARGGSGEQPVATDPVPLDALLCDVVSQLDSQARQQDVTIELDDSLKRDTSDEADDEAPLVNGITVPGDCSRLRRLFVNLLDNAVKHTPAGGHVRIHARPSDSTVRVTIEDSGCGIPAEHLPHLFDRFYRVDASRTTATGGTGLGLSICRSIVEAHGGSIEITSEAGQGTHVAVLLRVATE